MFWLPATFKGVVAKDTSLTRLKILRELQRELLTVFGLKKVFGFELTILKVLGEPFLSVTQNHSEYIIIPVGGEFMVESLHERKLLSDSFRVASYIIKNYQGLEVITC